MNIKNYIDRIQYSGHLSPTLDVLQQLQKGHLLNVPFENLDIHYDNSIVLDLDKIYTKVVEKGRGGFCYELNGLFHSLLKSIGFDAKIISANVYNSDKKEFGASFDHLTIIVTLEGAEYLVDVGFGEFSFFPLKIQENTVQADPRGNFSFEKAKNGVYTVFKQTAETKTIEYQFTLEEKALHEFTEMCQYHQSSSNSHFTQQKLISRPTINGRITLTGGALKRTESGVVVEEVKFEKQEFGSYLMKWFDIVEPNK